MKTLFASALLICASITANASPITVTYSESSHSGLNLHGSFSGVDSNNDGVLSFGELTSWTINYTNGDLPYLNDFGDFNYKANVWTPNGLDWYQNNHNAYMTWDNWSFSVNTTNNNWMFATTVEGDAEVPEPASLALIGISLAALAVSRRKKQG